MLLKDAASGEIPNFEILAGNLRKNNYKLHFQQIQFAEHYKCMAYNKNTHVIQTHKDLAYIFVYKYNKRVYCLYKMSIVP